MSACQPFMPQYGANQIVTVGATAVLPINPSCKQIRIVNTGTNKGYFRTFSSVAAAQKPAAGVATAADFCIPATMASTVTKDEAHDSIATFSAAGTTFEIITGEGF